MTGDCDHEETVAASATALLCVLGGLGSLHFLATAVEMNVLAFFTVTFFRDFELHVTRGATELVSLFRRGQSAIVASANITLHHSLLFFQTSSFFLHDGEELRRVRVQR